METANIYTYELSKPFLVSFPCLMRSVNAKMALVFALVILGISLWEEANAGGTAQSLNSGNLHSRRDLLSNGLGITPQMGWDSWFTFQCAVDQAIILTMADALVDTGLAKLGYNYVIIDDCWGEPYRDDQGNLVASNATFPSGIRTLANYVHSKNLKLGIYAESGNVSCTGTTAGSLGHEQQDAQTFASWGIDYLKYDNCNNDGTPARDRFATMSTALTNTGRPIFLSLSEWGESKPALWAPQIGNSWRTTGNIVPTWESITSIADLNDAWADYAAPGGWNDPDNLVVGNNNLSIAEARAQFSIWALMKAPLVIGSDLTSITSDILEILGNEEVIAVNQDAAGVQGKKVHRTGNGEVWAGPLSQGQTVVVLWNRSENVTSITATWQDIGFTSNTTTVQARDLWTHKYLPSPIQGNLTSAVDPHDVKMYVLTKPHKS